jgi:D-serine deaminase-like pyridoxal phosphate-dependent protein
VGIEAGKLPRAAALVRNGARLTLILDSVEATRSVAEFAAQERVKFHVLIEIDAGEGRSGVMPEAASCWRLPVSCMHRLLPCWMAR